MELKIVSHVTLICCNRSHIVGESKHLSTYHLPSILTARRQVLLPLPVTASGGSAQSMLLVVKYPTILRRELVNVLKHSREWRS